MKLKDSRENIKRQLEEQIQKGKDEFLSGKIESAKNFSVALKVLMEDFRNWHTFNVELLRTKFEGANAIHQYSPAETIRLSIRGREPDDLEKYGDLKESVQNKIRGLQGLIERLHLYEERPMYGSTGGKIDALHPRVIEVSAKLLKDGHFRAAVMDAFIALDNYIQNKTGRKDLNGTSLIQTVFSAKTPILKLSDDVEEQSGFMMLYTGAIKAIRNQYAHNVVNPADEQEAMEWLSFASALFRLADRAKP